MEQKRLDMTTGNINKLLLRLTIPMFFGSIGIVIFNLADTYFIGKLGTNQLAALSYTFPIVTFVNSIALGLGAGLSALVSCAAGKQDKEEVASLTTHGVLASVFFVVVVSIVGLLTIEPLFTLLGADNTVMPYIKEYMRIWYIGAIFVVVPMTGNNAIRALGDTTTPSIVMSIAAIVNIILDPVLIYGYGVIPELGVKGGAFATLFSRSITFFIAIYLISIREKIFKPFCLKIKKFGDSIRKISYIALPNALTKSVVPIASGIITNIISKYGNTGVAGFGTATRIEFFAICIFNALSAVISPFTGQNNGAGKIDRIRESYKNTVKFCVYYGISIFIILFLSANLIASLFSKSEDVLRVTGIYLRIVSFGYGFQGIIYISTALLNSINMPIKAAVIILFQIFVLYLPFSFFLSSLIGIYGVFTALGAAYVLSGTMTYIWTNKILAKYTNNK